jgi:hypothetical protein
MKRRQLIKHLKMDELAGKICKDLDIPEPEWA